MTRNPPAYLFVLLLAGALSVSCASDEGATKSAPQNDEADSAPPRTQADPRADEVVAPARAADAISYRTIMGRPFPFALIDVTIRGKKTMMIVDTGATHHVVDQAFAKETLQAELETANISGKGHVGEALDVVKLNDPQLSISGWGDTGVEHVYVVALPPIFKMAGVAGTISPQQLAREGGAMLFDMRPASTALTEVTAAEQVTWPAGLDVSSSTGPACVGDDAEDPALRYTMNVEVEGQSIRLEIDSGGSTSDIRGASDVGQALSPRLEDVKAHKSAGGTYQAGRIDGAKMKIGAHQYPLDLRVVPGPATEKCGWQGVIGVDVLKHCAVLMSRESYELRCAPPAGNEDWRP